MHLRLSLMANITLPDDFVKRWLVETNPDKLTAEDVERDYEGYSRSLRWQLIENKWLLNTI
jgi:trigger factor